MQLRSARFLGVPKKWRNNLVKILSGALVALALCLLASSSTYAADATIKDGDLTYGGTAYEGPSKKVAGDGLPSDIADGNIYYSHPSGDGNKRQVTFVFFTEKDAKKAKLAIYNYVPPSTYKLSGTVGTISLKNDGSAQPVSASAEESGGSGQSCTDAFGAMSWLACPIAEKSAEAVDNIMTFIMDFFMAVKPLSTDSNSPIYMVWSYMRDIANIAFIIFALVVVYSQVTGLGISNYGVKKVLPRIIIGAILINLSYFICAIAVDLSNILGDQLHSVFMGIRERAIAAGAYDINLSWGDLFATIAGAAAAGGLAILGIAIAGGAAGLMMLLLPILLGALLAVIAAFLTLAARQAIIMLLVIISPLALVSMLLPNTEKWFKKWYELGLKMLMIYPMFSLILGASELAGWAIIASASNIVQVILGMAVQFIPLVFTPILAKLSGNLLGSINSALHKPLAPLQKQAKTAADERRATAKARQLQNYQQNPTRFNRGIHRLGPTALAHRLEQGKRRRALDKSEAEGAVDKDFEATFDNEIVNGRQRRRVTRPWQTYTDHSRRDSRYNLERATSRAEGAKELAGAHIMTARSVGPLRNVSLETERAKTVHEATKKRFEEEVLTQRGTAGTGLYEASIQLEQMTMQADTAKNAFERVIKMEKLEGGGRLFHTNRTAAAAAEDNKTYGIALDKQTEGYLQVRKATVGDALNISNLRATIATIEAEDAADNLRAYIENEKSRRVATTVQVQAEDGTIRTETVEDYTALGKAYKRRKRTKNRADFAELIAENERQSTGEHYANVGANETIVGIETAAGFVANNDMEEMREISREVGDIAYEEIVQKGRADNIAFVDSEDLSNRIKTAYEEMENGVGTDVNPDIGILEAADGGRGRAGIGRVYSGAINTDMEIRSKAIKELDATYTEASNEQVRSELTEAIRTGDRVTITSAVNRLAQIGQSFMVYQAMMDSGDITNLDSAKTLQSVIMGNSTIKKEHQYISNFAKRLVTPDGLLASSDPSKAYMLSMQSFMDDDSTVDGIARGFTQMKHTEARDLDYSSTEVLIADPRLAPNIIRPAASLAAEVMGDKMMVPKNLEQWERNFFYTRNDVVNGKRVVRDGSDGRLPEYDVGAIIPIMREMTGPGWGDMAASTFDVLGLNAAGTETILNGMSREDRGSIRDTIDQFLNSPAGKRISTTRRGDLDRLVQRLTY